MDGFANRACRCETRMADRPDCTHGDTNHELTEAGRDQRYNGPQLRSHGASAEGVREVAHGGTVDGDHHADRTS